ncbi:glutaminyl-peptide cyclotransferase [Sediminibacterium sp. C3]|uniref:glutaminyl-peptide cyclotransferase n=1 Tax=Sediminibacterium sp. C3 TaxID=1267211 RepID=UPI0004100352|nr:glutaminyl-peptide cyclotransferase [Sediminibacterium sp. C3]
MRVGFLLIWLVLGAISCQSGAESETQGGENINIVQEPANISYQIIKLYPHDTSSFTQGLEWYKDQLWEGTGMEMESKLLLTDYTTGKAVKKVKLPDNEFGEGITFFKDKIYQLTWQEHKVYQYNAKTLQVEKTFDWPYEGWGLTHNDTALIVSTGGSNIYWVDPTNFKIVKTLGITDNNGYVDSINELEWVDGFLYANKYLTDYILKIDPATGQVVGRMNLAGILQQTNQPVSTNTDVLNGIAYRPSTKTFFVTGKRWPAMYEIKLN